MANNLTDSGEILLLDHLNGTRSWTPTTPLKIRLIDTNGTDSTAGTEIAAGGGYTAGGSTITLALSTNGSSSNSAAIEWTNMPACTVRGFEIYDSTSGSRSVTDGVTTASSTTVTSATAAFVANDLGAGISGGSIPAGAKITRVVSATEVTISSAATTSATAVSVTVAKAAQRLWHFPATANKTVNSGDTYSIAANAITLSID